MELVRAKYKTGVYLGKMMERVEQENRALIQVLAVLKHPMQGDLHHPKQVDVPLFHQRKALAYLEKSWMPLSTVQPYEGGVQDYTASLKEAWAEEWEKLQQQDSKWAALCLEQLEELKKEYGFSE
ncbi:kinase-associated lipoprotein B [Shouchella shacheensis]|uniref:kinase-associated lipoprotein B n=1 Tax=Shouchella shacheensis TaxID=1649580 RepID=UPI0007401B5E|nr:kinase-associated lipoprotein B [Shouchella shacheensis]